jgi:hypothetical protein
MSYYENYQIVREGSVRRRVLQSVGVHCTSSLLALTALSILTALAVWRIRGWDFRKTCGCTCLPRLRNSIPGGRWL